MQFFPDQDIFTFFYGESRNSLKPKSQESQILHVVWILISKKLVLNQHRHYFYGVMAAEVAHKTCFCYYKRKVVLQIKIMTSPKEMMLFQQSFVQKFSPVSNWILVKRVYELP